MFLDSDTKIALISSAPSDILQDWLLTSEQMAAARDKVNDKAAGSVGAQVGAKRLLSHAVFAPGQPGWLDHLDGFAAALAFISLQRSSTPALIDKPKKEPPRKAAQGVEVV
jgi:hypothetical protein